MAECECLTGCPYFEDEIMKNLDAIIKMRQDKYCKGDNSICARYMVFKVLGRENVPKDLLPFQIEKAKETIDRSKSE